MCFSNIPFLLRIIEYVLKIFIDFFKVIGSLFIDSLMVSTSLSEALLLIINFSFMLNWLFEFFRFLFS